MRVEAAPDVAEFIHAHGGALWVWAAYPRHCCSPVPARMYASTHPPKDVSGFRSVPVAGFELAFRAPGSRRPDVLQLEIRGRRRPRVAAYWDGAVLAL